MGPELLIAKQRHLPIANYRDAIPCPSGVLWHPFRFISNGFRHFPTNVLRRRRYTRQSGRDQTASVGESLIRIRNGLFDGASRPEQDERQRTRWQLCHVQIN
jgi:hypothetical protein